MIATPKPSFYDALRLTFNNILMLGGNDRS